MAGRETLLESSGLGEKLSKVRLTAPVWADPRPVRSELFGLERLEAHGISLAKAQRIKPGVLRSKQLLNRLDDNALALARTYRETAKALELDRPIAPAAEWLIDNYHIVEKQIRKIRDDLPPDFYRQLPKLADGPLATLPRVFGIAWAYVAHSDSLFEEERFRRFVAAYQKVNALTIGELWALAISLELVLVENLRRLADLSIGDEQQRARADAFADALFAAESDSAALASLAELEQGPQSPAFVSQLALRLRDVDSRSEMARRWLEAQAAGRGESIASFDTLAQAEHIAATSSIRNVIMAMRAIAEADWGEMVEQLSLADRVLRQGSNFAQMDFPSRNLYRNALEELSRGSAYAEDEVAAKAIQLASQKLSENSGDKDPGFHLIADGRAELEEVLHFVPPVGTRLARRLRAGGIELYIALTLVAGLLFALWPLAALDGVQTAPWHQLLLVGAALIVALETGTAVVNRLLLRLLPPRLIPALELEAGIPPSLRTLVVVPVLLGADSAIEDEIEGLELHHLATREGEVHYALLSDFADADAETLPHDAALLERARAAMARLNSRYPGGKGGPRFLFLHRRRQFNPAEGRWMGWERKRGKLHELNRLLRGAKDTSFLGPEGGSPVVPKNVRYVITLDADTRLPLGTARRMIGKMAHPLNRPRFDTRLRRVVSGHGILQPRVTGAMPLGRGQSPFERITGGPAGMDPYATASSDLYQDLLGEGSFTGKGIYEIDSFMASLAGRVPPNTMLSHDLFEGVFARAGLISDVEVVEDFPVRYDVATRRQHRWVRGDWQLLPWILWAGRDRPERLPAAGRAKMLDNLRRSLAPPAALAALIGGWFLAPQPAVGWCAAILLLLAIPPFLHLPSLLLAKRGRDVPLRAHLDGKATDVVLAVAHFSLMLATLADQAVRMLDAIFRTLFRMALSRRHLLEWTTAAQTATAPNPGIGALYRLMWPSVLLALVAAGLALWLHPGDWVIVLPLALAWVLAPVVAWQVSRPARTATPVPSGAELDAGQRETLERIARETFGFFEAHVTAEHNHLPPDNFQEDPEPVVAGRTSPTNIGLYLLVVATARNRGWIAHEAALSRLEASFRTIARLAKHRGHLFNWYDTRDLRVLDPAYVSAVDSGNLAGHLIALANLAEEWGDARSLKIAEEARAAAMAMDFSFLVDPERNLLSIGWSAADNRRDEGCYDLLASEARLASLFAIAKGDLPAKHWLRLGRSATAVGGASVLISWSGSMFEYLMPSLLMRAPDGSLLEVSNRLVVERQRDYAKEAEVPWGISESAYNGRDREMTYQYSNFGVPGLGLKRGLSENLVIAPYATGLATMVDAPAALENYAILEAMGARGRYGFYEALDFTPGRVPEGQRFAIVKTYMAHHQGMALLAIANVLDGGRLREAFHSEPMIRATELLLQERRPRGVGTFNPRAEEATVAAVDRPPESGSVRNYGAHGEAVPPVHLLSNGRYSVLVSSAGAGFSRWKGMAINRWREDPVVNSYGQWIYLTDRQAKLGWSATLAPAATATGPLPAHYAANFMEGRAEFHRRDGMLTTTTEVLISPEDDAEVRRVSVANNGRRQHQIDITSCIELALAKPETDLAHPAFARMFLETELFESEETGGLVLIGRRRPRDKGDPPIWVAHLAVVEGTTAGPVTFETDRSAFIGRGRTSADPLGFAHPLAGHLGTVLDPVLALRCPMLVEPGTTVRVAFWTIAAESRELLLEAVDRHHDPAAFDRANVGAWTQAQIERRFLKLDPGDAADFQRLAAHLVHAGPVYAPPAALVAEHAGPQSALWVHGISGDIPILLCRIEDGRDMALVQDLLQAFEFLRARSLAFDLVILNERKASYIQDLQVGIDDAVRAVRSRPAPAGVRGDVFTLRSDLMLESQVLALRALTRVELLAQRGPLRRQLQRPEEPAAVASPVLLPARPLRKGRPADPDLPRAETLEYWNGFGGFHAGGREYAMILPAGSTTPAPWINVLANPQFGCHVSADACGAIWSGNARENQLTPWSNDVVSDPPGDVLYVRDLESGHVWSPTRAPAGEGATRITRHGFGYTRFHALAHGIETDLLQHVPLESPVRLARLTLRNLSSEPRPLSVTGYAEWVLGQARSKTASHLVTELDAETGALFVRNPFDPETGGRIAFADLDGCQTQWTCDRTTFLGSGGSTAAPDALKHDAPLNSAAGAGLDPCAVLGTELVLAPGEAREIVWTIGQAADRAGARELVQQWRSADLDAELARTTAHWAKTLGTVEVKTPDRAMDLMLNGWLLYQVLGCRVWGRAGFYQASGAYGFRDQLQDGGALLLARPDLVRPHLLRAAGRQFREGDVQHWWLPESGRGVRTMISDDRGWLAISVADYVETTGDIGVLETQIPFLEGRKLEPGEHDAFFQPSTSSDTATLYAHCALALDQSMQLTGELGIPLIGGGDWNDGMNRVGEGGRGQSVWLGWHLIHAWRRFARYAETREPERAARWLAHADSVRAAIERHAWDGEWYRRATYDDGTWLGSKDSDECRIDSIAQTWSILSGAGEPERAAQAMQSVGRHLVDPERRIVKLFTPPFDKTDHDPGYIRSYPPGLRENGGQYSHAAMWTILAAARMGDGDLAVRLFGHLNPINHALNAADAAHYRVEPYVVAADVYSVPPNDGRGGWTWYTGAAGWMYRAGVEGIFGLKRWGNRMEMKPCLPKDWPEARFTLRLEGGEWEILIGRAENAGPAATLDGRPLNVTEGAISWPLDAGSHRIVLHL
ncbi:GH36-type glycosyl hydrolase domain-containing protein [Sandaracinobacteroides hominis]|uniref:GH36-type glycosyl hydrolase domain-containing protein n=1 Tax=Sandaracinobacteroides hominis TaxID=2780086 RepID=UPI0018F7AA52|nr:glucoamylase family protein [Sandaracinobacteroides hominis]